MIAALHISGDVADELTFVKYALDEHAIVATTDLAGTIVSVNAKFCQISKFSAEELVGQNHRIINSGRHPKAFFVEMWKAISSGSTWRGEICNRAKDGTLYWVDTTIVPIRHTGGPLLGYVAIRADITEQKLAQEKHLEEVNAELRRKNAELEQYVHSVSHDLKSPIVTILGFAGMMRKNLGEGQMERLADNTERIIRAAGRMRCVIDDLLELSRVGRTSGEVGDVDLSEAARSVLEELRERITAAGIRVEVGSPMPTIRAERMRVWQVLQNLVINAVHYGSTAAAPVIEIGASRLGDTVTLYVRDNGKGIAEEHHERVFGLFQRLERKGAGGTGVGLAIVRRIAETHRGRAWVESSVGAGSTFRVSMRDLVSEESADAKALAEGNEGEQHE